MFPQACCHFSETLSIVAKNSHIYASLPHAFFYIYCFGSASCKLQDNWDIDPTSFPREGGTPLFGLHGDVPLDRV